MEHSCPTISVCIPVYNHGSLLPRSLEAYLSQSSQVDEILLLDDASTDNTLEVINSYASKHSHIRVFRNEENRGVIYSAHRLLREAEGRWSWFVAADDYPEPGSVEAIRSMLPLAEETGAGILFGKMRTVTMDGQEKMVDGASGWDKAAFITPHEYLNQFLREEPPMISLSASTIFNTKLLAEAGGQKEEIGPWADTFVLRYLALKHGAVYVPQVLNNWSMDDSTFSGKVRQSTRKQLKLFSSAAKLMRHPAYRDGFPEEYVREFERSIRKLLYRNFLSDQVKRLLGVFSGRYRTSEKCSTEPEPS